MRKQILLLLILLCAAVLLKAQQPKIYSVPKDDSAFRNKLKNKAFVDSLKNELWQKSSPYINTPLAGSMPKRFNYAGNNKKGFDIYQTPQDNMYILKPDSTFASNMPVANSYNIYIKPVEMPNADKEKRLQ